MTLRDHQERLLNVDTRITMAITATKIARADGLWWSLPPQFFAAWEERRRIFRAYLAAKRAA